MAADTAARADGAFSGVSSPREIGPKMASNSDPAPEDARRDPLPLEDPEDAWGCLPKDARDAGTVC